MKRIILTLSSLFLYSLCSAQSSAHDFQNVVPVNTTAPDVASIGKFGNVPVSYATGVPSINIPIYDITVGKIRLPLSLDYHAGGVRVDEIASSVGLSWALNGIGMVSRNMIGRPDEDSYGGFLRVPTDSVFNYYNFTFYGSAKSYKFAGMIQDIRDNIKETEPDVFSYDVGGSSGKFMYKQNGTFIQIPVTNNRIEKVNGTDFKITTENGITYIFDQRETTYSPSESPGAATDYVSSWRLSKIIDHTMADTVYISYQSVLGGNSEVSHNFTHTLAVKKEPGSNTFVNQLNSSIHTISHPVELYPSEIRWRGGKVRFVNASGRSDRSSEMRLDSVKVYTLQNGSYKLIRGMKLYQSYFFSNPYNTTPDGRNYRLRLDSVAVLPVSGSQRQSYRVAYNDIPIPPNESYAQDSWGYSNNKTTNTSLMPAQTVYYQNAYYNIGQANRYPDTTQMQACMIKSIQYPTKGKSVFEFETHTYFTDPHRIDQTIIAGVDLHDGVHQTTEDTFTLGDTTSQYRYSVYISTFSAQQGVTDYPRAIIFDQTTGQEVLRVTNIHGDQTISQDNVPVSLIPGHTYVVTGSTYTTNASVRVRMSVTWVQSRTSTIHDVGKGGGLRVKSITNYDNDGSFISRKFFNYGVSDNAGILLTPSSYLLPNYEKTYFESHFSSFPQTCATMLGDESYIYHANSIYSATQFSGSPVAYDKVTEFDVDSTGNTRNGKIVYEYAVEQDVQGSQLGDFGTIGVLLTSNSWLNGFLKKRSTYKLKNGSYTPVHVQQNFYDFHRSDQTIGLKVKPLYIKEGSCEIYGDTTITRSGPLNPIYGAHFYLYQVTTSTGALLLKTQADTTWDDAGRKYFDVHNSYYEDSTHNFPTKTEQFTSTGDNLTNVIKYPHDFAAAGNVYQKMMDRNIISPVVRFQQLKNGNQLALANINYYDWFGNSKLLLPQTVDEQVLTNPIVTRTRFNNYDAYGDILQQQKVNGPYQSYQWGYNKQYPVVVIANAASNEFYAENFEESTAANVTTGTGHTGTRFYNGSYTVNWTRPNSRSYVISYWYLSNGSWLLQNAIPYTGSSYTLTGGSAYDDIRIYPVDSQMSTYTYLPLIGMTSATDAKNLTTYYEYDDFQRLKNVKDKDGNIVKHDEYHYKEQ
ncbi:hypothetical protein FHW88_000513 [Mucilaginibacter sp. SG538B]|uniref:hypothetical protein n=1 Tax=Mucilaginibacter sp. SG538B TaxID=2587021 RepID=UPI00159D62AA|nr:hypothetical protein [Mucilaginibacter sp. SG538B]NVM62237.1 hypothetical protein [Mucilaginibacter sp. SG538B]